MATLNTAAYTDPMLADLEGAGAGERKRIDDAAQATLGSLVGRLFSTGLGTSSLIGSFTLGNEDRHQQALLDLSDKLIGQRLSARQAGASLGLQQYGIDTGAENQRYGIDKQASTAAAQLQEQRYGTDLNYDIAKRQIASRMAGSVGFASAGPQAAARPRVPPFTLGMPTSTDAINSWNASLV
jgi:hypothetical protein